MQSTPAQPRPQPSAEAHEADLDLPSATLPTSATARFPGMGCTTGTRGEERVRPPAWTAPCNEQVVQGDTG